MSKLPSSYKCKSCGREHTFPSYVYANWHVGLHHRCECGAVSHFTKGRVTKHQSPSGGAK